MPPTIDPPKKDTDAQILERLGNIEMHLRRIDRRDQIRITWSAVRAAFQLMIVGFLIWSSVYFLQHLTDVIKTISSEAAKQAIQYSTGGSPNFFEQIQQILPKE